VLHAPGLAESLPRTMLSTRGQVRVNQDFCGDGVSGIVDLPPCH
jgi:hypothetical protein